MMTNRKQFIKNGILLTAVAVAIRTVNLFYSAFVANAVGAEGIGLFTLIMNVFGFAVTFASAGISLSVTSLVASALGEGREEHPKRILRTATLYAIGFGGTATAVLFFLSAPLSRYVLGDIRAALPLAILSVSLIPAALSAVYSGYFIGIRRVSNNACVQIATQGFKILFTVMALSFSEGLLGVGEACTLLAVICTLTDIVGFLVLSLELFLSGRRGGEIQKHASGTCFREFSAVALPLAVSAYIRQALLTLEHVLIPKRLLAHGDAKADALASYGVLHGMALPLILYPMATLSSFSGLLVPEFAECKSRGEYERMNRIASRALSYTLVYAIATATFVYLFSEELGHTIYRSGEAGAFIAMLAPVIPLMYLDHVTDSVLKGIGEQVYSMWVNITDSALSVILVFFLLPKLGITGYALVIVIMEGYNFLLSFLRLRGRVKLRLSVFTSIVFPLLGAAASAVITKHIFPMNGSTVEGWVLALEIIFAAALFFFIYTLLCFLIPKTKKASRQTKSAKRS